MLQDHLLDRKGGLGEMWAQSRRCTNCGAVHDAVIAQNRRTRQENVSLLNPGEHDTQKDDIYLGGEAFIHPAAYPILQKLVHEGGASMNTRAGDSQTQSRKTLPPFKNRRKAERDPTHWRVTYTYEAGGSTYIVDGVTRDLCKIGCGIRGTVMPPLGSKTRLKVYLPDRNYPISLDARITWVEGNYFGVRFPGMDKKNYMQVRQHMRCALMVA